MSENHNSSQYGDTHTFDLFGELDPVGVGQGAGLFVNVVDVQDLTHELDHWLGFIESCS